MASSVVSCALTSSETKLQGMTKYWLIILNEGEKTNITLPLPIGELLIGRGDKCDVIIPSGKVSRRHVIITHEENQVGFRDCGSNTGTLLNGKEASEGTLAINED